MYKKTIILKNYLRSHEIWLSIFEILNKANIYQNESNHYIIIAYQIPRFIINQLL